jgi:long-chain acyl-CoA synthetase
MAVAETTFETASEMTAPELFEQRTAETPEALAVRAVVDELTFREWRLRSAGVRELLEDFRAVRGERVALWMTNDEAASYVCALQAVLDAAAMSVALDDRLALPEARRILHEAEPRALLISRLVAARLGDEGLAELGLTGFHSAEAAGEVFALPMADATVVGAPIAWDASMTAARRPSPARAADSAMIAYTSGSTGTPKGPVWTQSALCQYAERVAHATYADPRGGKALSRADVLQSPIPLYTTASIIENLYPMVLSGCTLVYEGRRFDPAASEQRMATYGTTIYNAVPPHYALMGELPPTPGAAPELMLSGGSAITADLYRRMRARWPSTAIANWYGLNESGTGQTLNYGEDMERAPGSIGRPIWPTEVRIVDDGGTVEQGEEGELWMRAPGQMTEYFRNRAETEKRLRGDWLRTGDRAFIDEDGLIHVVGRGEERINRGGFKLYPAEIEAALEEHEAVREAAVAAIPHPVLGEDVAAFVVASARVDEGTLRDHCRRRIAANKVPSRIIFVAELPRGAYGKVLRRELVARYAEPA